MASGSQTIAAEIQPPERLGDAAGQLQHRRSSRVGDIHGNSGRELIRGSQAQDASVDLVIASPRARGGTRKDQDTGTGLDEALPSRRRSIAKRTREGGRKIRPADGQRLGGGGRIRDSAGPAQRADCLVIGVDVYRGPRADIKRAAGRAERCSCNSSLKGAGGDEGGAGIGARRRGLQGAGAGFNQAPAPSDCAAEDERRRGNRHINRGIAPLEGESMSAGACRSDGIRSAGARISQRRSVADGDDGGGTVAQAACSGRGDVAEAQNASVNEDRTGKSVGPSQRQRSSSCLGQCLDARSRADDRADCQIVRTVIINDELGRTGDRNQTAIQDAGGAADRVIINTGEE